MSAGAHARSPIARGTLLALAAALSFGATTPLVQRYGRGLGPFSTAAFLYLGASLVGALTRTKGEAPLRMRHVPRLVAVAIFGAALAPTLLAAGLQRASGTTAALLLNLEAAFTIALGALLFKEHVGRRVVLAALVLGAGGAVLVLSRAHEARAGTALGLAMVAGATLGWALDNALSKPLSGLDPSRVVAAKGALGAGLSLALGLFVFGEHLNVVPPITLMKLALCGAVGYGASLRLYLLAQRSLGAARTASVFAAAPFAGAALALAMGEPLGGAATAIAGALMALGAYLHLTERHEHEHEHAPMTHEHAHRHDDGHHDHAHEVMPEGEHSHVHTHEGKRHEHPHAPDEHHAHHH